MKIQVSKLREEIDSPHHLITTSDDKVLFLRTWFPKISPKNKAILIFHGITAHSEPYEMIADPLSQEGYSVFGLDLRGHGLSDGNRGDYPSKERFARDLCETIAYVKKKVPVVILLGHSLGVLSAITALNHCLEDIDGLILSSLARTVKPGVYPPISIGKKLKILFSSIFFPRRPVISYYREGMLGLDDPLFNFNYTLRFMKISGVSNPNDVKFPNKLNFPIFYSIGEQDELFEVESCKNLFAEIPCENKEFFVIQGAKHAEFPEGSWIRLVAWLNENFH
ncbi:MAG: alpha/beta hydrolase [Candidatus Hodarchaeales archaeon]|jgi:alpha-beta hydrolase superfamily lysophospholipase